MSVRRVWFLLIAASSFGQAPHFEVASIKITSPDNSDASSGIRTGHGRLDAHNVTLKRCLIGAYGVGPHQIAGGPDWIGTDRFEISAKAGEPVNDDAALMLMLRGLLTERFHLVLRLETKTLPALVLELAKNGPRLEKAGDGEASTNTRGNGKEIEIDARYTSMDAFAKVLAREMDLPVVNQTRLDGAFHFKLHWTPDRVANAIAGDAVSLYSALPDQLGLRLRSQKAPVDVLVIEHVEKPSEN